jgi:hypothetical protein
MFPLVLEVRIRQNVVENIQLFHHQNNIPLHDRYLDLQQLESIVDSGRANVMHVALYGSE